MRIILLLATVLIIGSPVLSLAQQCGQSYRVRGGETIYDIAARVYGDGEKWSLIYYANQDLLQNDPTSLKAGDSIRIPCLDRGAAGASTAPRDLERGADAELKLLTGGDYAPFTGQALPGGGLITEIVNAAFEAAPYPVTFSLTWEDDWGQHLDPLLSRKEYDVGFPWLRPDCRQDPENFRCRFHFSEPLFEMLILLFVRADGEVRFREDADIAGLTLCRPEGYYTHDLNRPDRQWLDQGVIELVQPASLGECFELLMAGEVDGVPVNEFTGRMKVREMGLGEQVAPIGDRPISLEGLHVLISKTHPRGTTFLYRFNAGLRSLKESERYQAILDRQMSAFWERLAAQGPAAAPVSSEPARAPEPVEEPAPGMADAGETPATPETCRAMANGWRSFDAGEHAAAAPLLREAASAGHPVAEYALGILHSTGDGVAQDPDRALDLFQRAAAARMEGVSPPSAYLVVTSYLQREDSQAHVSEVYTWAYITREIASEDMPFYVDIVKLLETLEQGGAAAFRTSREAAETWLNTHDEPDFPHCREADIAGEPAAPREQAPAPGGAGLRYTGNGTGFFVSGQGHVLTNHHVIDSCRRIEIKPLGMPAVPVEVIAISPRDDLGLLKAEVSQVPRIARFRVQSDPRIGEDLWIFGYPLSGIITTSGNLTSGIISALAGPQDDYRLMQITAQIQPGNSGGPITDSEGRVIGVVVSKLNEVALLEEQNTMVQNVNFGIKGPVARSFLEANGVRFQRGDYQAEGSAAEITRQIAVRVNCFG